MTEYEYLDFQASMGSLATENAMSFITVFFAYIVCAYLVGKKITTIQSIGLTLAYSPFSLLTILGLFDNLSDFYEVAKRYPQYANDPGDVRVYIYGGPLALFSAWLMSIVYMISQNRNRNEDVPDEAA